MQVLKENTYTIKEKIDKFHGSIFLKIDKSLQKIALDSILFVKGYGDYMMIHCREKAHTVHITMHKLESLLPSSDFYRVHKSYLVRIDQITKISHHSIEINETVIPVSRSAKPELMEVIPLVK